VVAWWRKLVFLSLDDAGKAILLHWFENAKSGLSKQKVTTFDKISHELRWQAWADSYLESQDACLMAKYILRGWLKC
jgi:hypothetical protein